jgi:hypothetical protein
MSRVTPNGLLIYIISAAQLNLPFNLGSECQDANICGFESNTYTDVTLAHPINAWKLMREVERNSGDSRNVKVWFLPCNGLGKHHSKLPEEYQVQAEMAFEDECEPQKLEHFQKSGLCATREQNEILVHCNMDVILATSSGTFSDFLLKLLSECEPQVGGSVTGLLPLDLFHFTEPEGQLLRKLWKRGRESRVILLLKLWRILAHEMFGFGHGGTGSGAADRGEDILACSGWGSRGEATSVQGS